MDELWSLELLSGIDADLVEEAACPAVRPKRALRVLAVAACLCVLLALAAVGAEHFFGVELSVFGGSWSAKAKTEPLRLEDMGPEARAWAEEMFTELESQEPDTRWGKFASRSGELESWEGCAAFLGTGLPGHPALEAAGPFTVRLEVHRDLDGTPVADMVTIERSGVETEAGELSVLAVTVLEGGIGSYGPVTFLGSRDGMTARSTALPDGTAVEIAEGDGIAYAYFTWGQVFFSLTFRGAEPGAVDSFLGAFEG